MSVVCETERLYIRQFNTHDTEFIVRLLIMMTFQMLYMMSVMLYETYVYSSIKKVVLHQLSLFVFYIILNSALLIKTQKKQAKS